MIVINVMARISALTL